jgi:transcriptional regulator with XRE-family HTH domain
MSKPTTVSRAEVAEIFRRFRGAAKDLARELGVSNQAVHNWLKGKPSQRIERAAFAKAIELLKGCNEPEKLCLPCPLRPICEQLARATKPSARKSLRERI